MKQVSQEVLANYAQQEGWDEETQAMFAGGFVGEYSKVGAVDFATAVAVFIDSTGLAPALVKVAMCALVDELQESLEDGGLKPKVGYETFSIFLRALSTPPAPPVATAPAAPPTPPPPPPAVNQKEAAEALLGQASLGKKVVETKFPTGTQFTPKRDPDPTEFNEQLPATPKATGYDHEFKLNKKWCERVKLVLEMKTPMPGVMRGEIVYSETFSTDDGYKVKVEVENAHPSPVLIADVTDPHGKLLCTMPPQRKMPDKYSLWVGSTSIVLIFEQ